MKTPSRFTTGAVAAAAAILVGSAVAGSASTVDAPSSTSDDVSATAAALQVAPEGAELGVYSPRDAQCVLFDTRGTSRVAADGTRTFSLTTPTVQGGEPNCVVPESAVGVHVNLVAVQPTGFGNLKIFGASETTEPNGGIVNFSIHNPRQDNSNAFNMDQDPSGWTVRANGSETHVRAVLYGFYYEGSDSFATADHDHMVTQSSGGSTAVDAGGTGTAVSGDIDLATQCPAGSTELHTVKVEYSGTVQLQATAGVLVQTDLELVVDGTIDPDAQIELDVAGTALAEQYPVARTWVLTGLEPGPHTIEVRVESQDTVGVGTVTAELDLVTEGRGWTC